MVAEGVVLFSSQRGRGFYGASLVIMGFALVELFFMFVPKVKSLERAYELFHFFVEAISPKLAALIGTGVASQTLFNIALIWLASFAAIASFTRKTDDTSVWRSIATDSCGRLADGSAKHFACTSRKWLATLVGGPFMIVWALWHRRSTKTHNVSVGYVTINPSVLINYLKHLAIVAAMLVSGLLYLTGKSGDAAPHHGYAPQIKELIRG